MGGIAGIEKCSLLYVGLMRGIEGIEKGTVHVIRGNARIGKGTLCVCNVLGKVIYV